MVFFFGVNQSVMWKLIFFDGIEEYLKGNDEVGIGGFLFDRKFMSFNLF